MAKQNNSKIVWNRVTWFSRLCALVLFLAIIPALCFYIGTQYESAMSSQVEGQ